MHDLCLATKYKRISIYTKSNAPTTSCTKNFWTILKMLPSHFPSMLLLATVLALSLMITPANETSIIIIHGEEQNLLSQVPQIFVLMPNPLTTTYNIPPSTINQKAFVSDDISYVSPLLSRKLLKSHVPPSTTNPSTYIPHSTMTQRKRPPPHPSMLNKADVPPSSPNPRTYIPNSTRSQRKSTPHPSMLNKTDVPQPNPGTHIPASTTSHNVAPLLDSP